MDHILLYKSYRVFFPTIFKTEVSLMHNIILVKGYGIVIWHISLVTIHQTKLLQYYWLYNLVCIPHPCDLLIL